MSIADAFQRTSRLVPCHPSEGGKENQPEGRGRKRRLGQRASDVLDFAEGSGRHCGCLQFCRAAGRWSVRLWTRSGGIGWLGSLAQKTVCRGFYEQETVLRVRGGAR